MNWTKLERCKSKQIENPWENASNRLKKMIEPTRRRYNKEMKSTRRLEQGTNRWIKLEPLELTRRYKELENPDYRLRKIGLGISTTRARERGFARGRRLRCALRSPSGEIHSPYFSNSAVPRATALFDLPGPITVCGSMAYSHRPNSLEPSGFISLSF